MLRLRMIPWGRIALIVAGVMLVGVVAAGAWMGLVEAHLGLGQAACFLELHAEAETALKRLIELNPRKAPAYSYLGAICFQQAGYVEAIPSLENAVLLDPNDADPWAMLGRCLVLLGRPADAIDGRVRLGAQVRWACGHADVGALSSGAAGFG